MMMAFVVMMVMFRPSKFVSKMHFFQFCLPVVLMVVENGESLRDRLRRGSLYHYWFVVAVRRRATFRMVLA